MNPENEEDMEMGDGEMIDSVIIEIKDSPTYERKTLEELSITPREENNTKMEYKEEEGLNTGSSSRVMMIEIQPPQIEKTKAEGKKLGLALDLHKTPPAANGVSKSAPNIHRKGMSGSRRLGDVGVPLVKKKRERKGGRGLGFFFWRYKIAVSPWTNLPRQKSSQCGGILIFFSSGGKTQLPSNPSPYNN